MTRVRVAVFAAVLLGLLSAIRPCLAGEAWNPNNDAHAKAIHAFACDEELFPTLSKGSVKASYATPSDLARHLARHGIDLSDSDAATLLNELELTIKGRNPRKISPADLVMARRPGSTGLHGHFAEIDYVKSNPDYVNFSSDGSATTDVTQRNRKGKVAKYCQVKCRSTAAASLEGIVENWLKFHAKDRGGSAEFVGVVPKDQFEALVKEGKVAPDGTVRDTEMLSEIEGKVKDRVDKGKYGATNQKLLQDGLAAKRSHPLKIAPLPKTYAEYTTDAATHQNNSTKSGSPLTQPAPTAKSSVAVAGYGGAAALALLSLSQSRDLKTAFLASAESMISILEQSKDFSGQQKYQVQRAMRALPKWLKPSMPKVSTIRSVGRWAARAGAVVAVAFLAVDVYRYANGTMSTRDFASSSSQLAAGVAGGWLGAETGLAVGASIGSIFPGAGTVIGGAIGAVVGGVIGSFGGAWVASTGTSAVWASFDKQEIEYAIELIRERYRAMESNQPTP